MFAEAEKQNEEIKRWKRENERERGRGMNCLQRNGSNWLCLKSKGKSYLKDVDRGLELAETLTENGQGNIRLGPVPESEAFEAKQKVREVIEMNNKWAKGYKN